MSRIAILGWGSLLWDTREDFEKRISPWEGDGPVLKLEFSRISLSRSGALTLVIDQQHGSDCIVAFTISKRADPEDAICDLRSREGTTRKNIGWVHSEGEDSSSHDPTVRDHIQAWSLTQQIDVTIWTDLASNWEDKRGKPFSIEGALDYLKGLDPQAKAVAAEYVWRAPDFIQTPLRKRLETEPWFQNAS